MLVVLYTFLVAASAVSCTVYVSNPIDNQLPLIARIGQKFYWSFSSTTFTSDTNNTLSYTAYNLPGWLTFNNATRSFSGTPQAQDEGTPELSVTAQDSHSSATSTFSFCVTPYPPPTLELPIEKQFYAGNPSLSSVFFLAPESALATSNPTLRIPPSWSFSVGLEGDTYTSQNDLYYDALLIDGSPLPDWIDFNTETFTFDGVAPHKDAIAVPYLLSIALHASDQQGYTADILPFDLVIADHELSSVSSLPTINITAASPFSVALVSPADFSGILMDGQPIQPANITALSINLTPYAEWLKYDPAKMTLSGKPPDNIQEHAGTPLPVALTSNFNQTIRSDISFAVVPSFFSSSNLGSIVVDPGQKVQFDLTWYFSNATDSANKHSDVNLTAIFIPSQAGSYLIFDPVTAELTGKIPSDSNVSEITVSLTAYSNMTHSTSHTSLTITSSSAANKQGGPHHGIGSMSPSARKRLILILSVVFGVIGGIVGLLICLALFRRFARVRDTALEGEEGTRAWTADEKKWYGIGGSLEIHKSGENPFLSPRHAQDSSFANLGLGLRRISPRSPSLEAHSQQYGVMRKKEFLGKIKETARNVSDRYKRKVEGPKRPKIGNPVLIVPDDDPRTAIDGLPFENKVLDISKGLPSGFTASPSSSTGERSIPRRRADFAPPKSPKGPREPPQVHVKDFSGQRRSLISNSSARTHVTEPVHSVVREVSLRSTKSASVLSLESHVANIQIGEERPRLMPFTHAARVPVPRSLSGGLQVESKDQTKRVTSQTAKVFKELEGSMDELRMGMHYVRALGGDKRTSENGRSTSDKSFSSLESSQHGHGQAGTLKENTISRILVRTGERFKFRIPIKSSNTVYRKVEARLVSGQALPGFLQLDFKGSGVGVKDKKMVEFFGVPTENDIGEVHVGVYTIEDGDCLAKVIVEVVGRS
ncbi:hypothetical protein SERLA73DRAFT_113744 [Serpula lacrymans var. lacrymans S7.3]|uniref:Dystroglycan-type cadherin-like domain-containing protein n=1 Tax=Serpula lacrymans var. lacrymans (strain S7.3) TaxID=936435 RepID=F8Q8W5_SERL3|nr:hypothetical protein SERLA73DRAFT_113744 [Serpula lacrymans var. lacrymans S7.3]